MVLTRENMKELAVKYRNIYTDAGLESMIQTSVKTIRGGFYELAKIESGEIKKLIPIDLNIKYIMSEIDEAKLELDMYRLALSMKPNRDEEVE